MYKILSSVPLQDYVPPSVSEMIERDMLFSQLF